MDIHGMRWRVDAGDRCLLIVVDKAINSKVFYSVDGPIPQKRRRRNRGEGQVVHFWLKGVATFCGPDVISKNR